MRCYTLDLETLRPREVDGTQIVQRVPTRGQASVYMAQVPSPSGSDRLVASPRGASHPGEKSSRAAGGSSMGTRENRSAFLAQLKREKLTRAKLDALVEGHDLSADAQTVSKQRWWWWALFLPSEYGLNPTPHTNEGCTDADCDDVMVLETVNGGGSSKEGLGAKVDRGSSYTIDGDVVGRSIFGKAPVGEEVGFFDSTPDEVASRIPGVYSMAPDELRSLWPTMEGYWDDPSCTWLYYRFKEAAIEDITAKNACNDPLNAATETEEVYVVSGMMPFLAYDLRSVDSVIVCQGGVQKLLIRVRYWAGFIHHFSFFVADGFNASGMYDLTDLPSAVYEPATDETDFMGVRAEWWMKFTRGITAQVTWTPAMNQRLARLYHCDANEFGSGHAPGYKINFDDPGASFLCFSDWADSDERMTSFLGQSVTAEICFAVEPDEARDLDGIVRDGFDRLFGGAVAAQLSVSFTDPVDPKAAPRTVTRTQWMDHRWLMEVSEVYRNVTNLRRRDQGKWLFRSHDANDLLKAARDREEPPCCS